MSSLKGLGEETKQFYILLDAIDKIGKKAFLQSPSPENQFVLSLKEAVEKWTRNNRAQGVDLPYYTWVAPNDSRPTHAQEIIRLAKRLRKNSLEFHIPTRMAKRNEKIQQPQLGLLEILWEKCSNYTRPSNSRRSRRTTHRSTAPTHTSAPVGASARYSRTASNSIDSHAILPSILDPPNHAFSLPSEAKLLKELQSIAGAWLDENDKWAAWTASKYPDTRITTPKALAEVINATCMTSLMEGSELLFFHQLLGELQKWELASNAILTDVVPESSQAAAVDSATATQTELAPASQTQTDTIPSPPQMAAAVTATHADLVPASPEVQATNVVTATGTNLSHASPQEEAPKQIENDPPKKRRVLGKGWGFRK